MSSGPTPTGGVPIFSPALDAAKLDDLKRVLEGAVDAAIILDQQHRVLYRNPAYDAYTGRRPREVAALAQAGTPCHQLFNLEICQSNCIMRRAVDVQKPLRMHEIKAKRGDGEDLTLIVTSTPLGGGLIVETYRDVTAESRVQRKYHALLAHERVAKRRSGKKGERADRGAAARPGSAGADREDVVAGAAGGRHRARIEQPD